jgi:regulator of nucleoside diphosphate kinase
VTGWNLEEDDMELAIAMDLGSRPHISITKRDLVKLENIIGNYAPIISWKAAEFLLAELKRARVVNSEAIPPTTVTMGSQVEFRDEGIGKQTVATLTYPDERALYRDSISILTPLGTALFGLSTEQSMSFLDQDGSRRKITVLEVLYQPEAGRAFRQSTRID